MFNYGGASLADIAAVTGNNRNNDGGWGGDGGWWVLIILFAIFGWGGNGFGGWGNGGGQGALTRGELCQDMNFSDLESGVRGVQSGLCDGFYAMNTNFGTLNNTLATSFAGVQNTLAQGFAGVNTGMITQGYESRLATQALGAQMAQCCCETNQNIERNTTQGVMNTNAIQQQIQQCCCDAEKQTMQTRFDMAQMNCGTLQAIDKLGDRIIDYMCNEKLQNLRDENQALRLAASQQAQNNYLVDQLRPCPTPAYITCNPWASQAPYGSCGNYGGCCGN